MKKIFFFAFLFLLFSVSKNVYAANKYWIGPIDGNISDVNNWATSASACGAGTVADAIPGVSDIAFFTATCTNTAVIDQAWSIAGINIAGGTITQSSALTIGTSDFTQTAGTFIGGSANIDIAGVFSLTGGTMTSTSGILSVEKNFTISSASFIHNSGTITLDGAVASSSSISTSGATLNKVIVNRSFSAFATRTFTIAANTIIPLGNDPTFLFRNTCGDQTCRVSVTNNGTITAGSGALSLTITGRGGVYNEYLYNNGAIDFSLLTSANIIATISNAADKTIDFSNVSAVTFVNLDNNGIINMSNCTEFNFNGYFSNNSGSSFETASGTKIFNMSGSFVIDANSTFPTTDITLNMTGTRCASANINAPSVTFNVPVVINRTVNCISSNITMTIAAGTSINLGNDPILKMVNTNSDISAYATIVNNGTITVGTGTLSVIVTHAWLGTHPEPFTNNGTINAATLSTVNFNTIFTNSAGAIFNAPNALNIEANGNISISASSTFPETLGTVTLSNTSYSNPKTTSYTSFIKNGASTLALGQGFTTSNFSISAGTISNPGVSQTINVTGNFSQTGGTLGGVNLPFVFNGSGTQILSKSGGTFSSGITVDKSSGVLSLSTGFGNAAGQSCTVHSGVFDLNGQAFTCGSDFVIQTGGTLRMMGTETPTAPILDTGSTVSFKGDGDAAPDTITITNFKTSYKGLSIDNAGIGGIDTFVLGAEIVVDGNLTINSGVFDVSTNNYTVNVSGNFIFNGGTFNAQSGIINLNGTSQSIDVATSVTFYGLTKNVVSSASLTLPASKTVIISNAVTLTGAVSNLLTIQSSAHETQAIVNFPVNQTMSYLVVHDINNIGTSVNTAGFNISNLGDNLGFNFNVAPTASTVANITQITDGLGYISFTTTVADNDNDVTKLKVEYSDNGGTDWYDPILVSATPSAGEIVLNNSDAYQIDSIDTTGGNVNLIIVWNTKSDLNGHGSLDNLLLSNLQVRVIANDFSVDSSASTSSNFAVDNVKPTVEITYSSSDPQKAGNILTITATYSEVMADSPIPKIIISGANTLAATNMIKDASTIYTYAYTVGAGNGNATIALSTGTDLFGNVVVATPTLGATFVVDNTAPIISISDPSTILTKSGPVTYIVTYTNADSISLIVGDITLNKTGTANGIVSLSGAGNSRTITLSAITGDGTLGVSIAAGTASDIAGNTSLGLGQEDSIVIDNTIPVITRVGKAIVKIYKNTTYTDAGANASDNIDGNVTASIVTDGLPINTAIAGTYEVSYDVSDSVGNNATQIIRTINVLEVPAQSQVLGDGATTSASTPAVVIGDNDTTLQTIIVPSSVTNATINVSAMTVSAATSTSVLMPSALSIDVSTALGTVSVDIPSGIEMVAQSSSWDGNINVPQIRENPSVTPTVEEGKTAEIASVIEVGYGETKLTFDKAVRVLISGQAGKYIGYSRSGTFYPITATCSADTQEVGDALLAEGDCKKDVGSDLVIWTKHFTEFTTYDEKINPVITWANPINIVAGTPLSATQLNATANVPGTFSYTPALGAVLEAGARVLSVTFTPTDTTTYNVVTDTANITVEAATTTRPSSSSRWPVVTQTTTTTIIPQQNTNQTVLLNLITLLKKLILEYKQITGSIPQEWEQFIVAEDTTKVSDISRDLYLGLTGDDVRMLQKFLINYGIGEKALKLKNNGASNYFGILTKNALMEYQLANKIFPAYGYFGKITRDYLKSIGK